MAEEYDDELIEKAKMLSEATGRGLDDVLADLADDGISAELRQIGRASCRERV